MNDRNKGGAKEEEDGEEDEDEGGEGGDGDGDDGHPPEDEEEEGAPVNGALGQPCNWPPLSEEHKRRREKARMSAI